MDERSFQKPKFAPLALVVYKTAADLAGKGSLFIVTVLADYGTRYQSKLFDPAFLRSKNLPVPAWLDRKSKIKPPFVS